MSAFNGVESAERSPSGKLSFAQRFAASRAQNEDRKMIPLGGGGGGPSEAIYEPRPEAIYEKGPSEVAYQPRQEGWTEVGNRGNPFGRTNRRDYPSGSSSYADYKKKKEEPKPLRFDDESAFPSLGGGKPMAAAVPKATGFAELASSWAAQDAATAEEQRRKEQETQEAQLERERMNRNTFMPRIFRSAPTYSEPRSYSPHSPAYDPYEDGAEPYEEPIHRNAILDDGNDDNEGWEERR